MDQDIDKVQISDIATDMLGTGLIRRSDHGDTLAVLDDHLHTLDQRPIALEIANALARAAAERLIAERVARR